MASGLEITKRNFFTEYHKAYNNNQDLAIEDYRYLTFTEFLDVADEFSAPIVCRRSGTFRNGNWKILGYCCDSYKVSENDEEENDEIEDGEDDWRTNDSPLKFNWEYTIFNGFFSDVADITKASKVDITKAINEIARFIEKTFSNDLINDVSAAKDLQRQLIKQNDSSTLYSLDICIVTDSVIEQENLESSIHIKSLDRDCNIYYWDLKKWNDLKRSKSKRLPINIDFKDKKYALYDIKYLEKNETNNLKYYLTVFPGNLIADLYDFHKTRILENNVRVFLSANRKANKAIRNTIKKEPHMFFSYNNGISATADSIIIENNKIIQINDFQIVNGGQTTASIHYSKEKDKCSLSDVFVAVKITSLKKEKKYDDIVKNISKAANTQTSIKQSDFHANDSYLIGTERLSIKHPVQNYKKENVYYFFERMSGQYNVTKNSRGTAKNIRIWGETHPKVLSFNKIDIARWNNTINLFPHVSALSAEKQFTLFMEDKNFVKNPVSKNRYKTVLGFGLLFKRARKLCGTKTGKEYPSIIGDSSVGMATTIYAMAYLQYISKGCLDFWSIYDYKYKVSESLTINKRTSSELDDILEHIIKKCWKQIAIFGGTSAQEQTKKKECWEYVLKNVNLDKSIKTKINEFTITAKERDSRDSDDTSNDDAVYFDGLYKLYSNNAQIIQLLYDKTKNNSKYISKKNRFKNLVGNLKNSKDKIITHNMIQEMMGFHNTMVSGNEELKEKIKNNTITISIDFKGIYNLVFKDKSSFWDKLETFLLDKIDNDVFEEFSEIEKELKDLLNEDGEYYLHPGFSIKQLERLQELFIKIEFIKPNT